MSNCVKKPPGNIWDAHSADTPPTTPPTSSPTTRVQNTTCRVKTANSCYPAYGICVATMPRRSDDGSAVHFRGVEPRNEVCTREVVLPTPDNWPDTWSLAFASRARRVPFAAGRTGGQKTRGTRRQRTTDMYDR